MPGSRARGEREIRRGLARQNRQRMFHLRTAKLAVDRQGARGFQLSLRRQDIALRGDADLVLIFGDAQDLFIIRDVQIIDFLCLVLRAQGEIVDSKSCLRG